MTREEEIANLRRRAAELLRRAHEHAEPLSAEEDAEILAILNEASNLEHQERTKHEDRKVHPVRA